MLSKKFASALAEASSTSTNFYLQMIGRSIKDLEDHLEKVPQLQQYNKNLLYLLNKPNFALNPTLTNEFAQTLGEAHFMSLCYDREILLERVKEEKTKKQPDFRYYADGKKISFEVKTPSAVDGSWGVKRSLENNLGARIEIETQLKSGRNIATAASVIQPYGEKDYEKSGKLKRVISVLINKTASLINAGQFPNSFSFLVINLSLLPTSITEKRILRPAYVDNAQYVTTGELWMMAFGETGMLVHSVPEFEGKPCLEGKLEMQGILKNPDFNYVSGLFFVVHPWNSLAEIWGAFRSDDLYKWENESPKVVETIRSLTNHVWNDDLDSNCFELVELD